ncbi:hypothetical protein ASG22_17065 [Chryseobacterium sp. Leaf405]|uniref:hypothetical protein n=1 Tax=Chryseobacterium sp. Leaf405 TaxID=1736367 RepID=UPI0006FC3C3C|nr:hypothetical protein [Chryseobacterium sp. Leaf405]KQT20684.1 hypothetical protein ASG22_17065 [Chryseobacterium sp. Leaf405]
MSSKNSKNAGRKPGSRNTIRQELRKELTELFMEQFTKEVRNFPVMDYEKRMRLLIGILPYVLPKANLTQEESEIQNLIYEKIYPEFRKLSTYLNVIPMDKKATILLSFVKTLNLTSTQQNNLASTINKGKRKP